MPISIKMTHVGGVQHPVYPDDHSSEYTYGVRRC